MVWNRFFFALNCFSSFFFFVDFFVFFLFFYINVGTRYYIYNVDWKLQYFQNCSLAVVKVYNIGALNRDFFDVP